MVYQLRHAEHEYAPPHPSHFRKGLALAILGALGIPLSLIESLPYMMVGMFSPRHTHGQLLGKLNVWIGEAGDSVVRLCVYLKNGGGKRFFFFPSFFFIFSSQVFFKGRLNEHRNDRFELFIWILQFMLHVQSFGISTLSRKSSGP